MKKFAKEFKEFISKGNGVDLAVAVVMGAAFGKIVSSLVDNIIMPLFGIIVGQKTLRLIRRRTRGQDQHICVAQTHHITGQN